MKKNFPQYYRPTEKEIEESAKSAIFIFDTNSLLDFYRINPKIADKVLDIIETYKDRVYIAHHTDAEYHRHHYEVPAQMSNTISKVRQRLNFDKVKAVIEDQFKVASKCEFPRDLLKEYLSKLKATYDGICNDVSKLQSQYDQKVRSHELQHRICNVFEDHILSGLSERQIEEIITNTGPERYKAKIPPGYMDAGKATDLDDNNTYGDLIIWFEILDFVKRQPNDVFFVCRDEKEDWVTVEGKWRIGPRMELIVEFRNVAPNNIFHICSLTDFLEYFDKNETLSTDELKAIRPDSPVSTAFIEQLLEEIPPLYQKMAGLDDLREYLYAENPRPTLQNIDPKSFWTSMSHARAKEKKPSDGGLKDVGGIDLATDPSDDE